MPVISFFKLYSIPFVILVVGVIFYYLIFSEMRDTKNKIDSLHAELNKRLGEEVFSQEKTQMPQISESKLQDSENVAFSQVRESQAIKQVENENLDSEKDFENAQDSTQAIEEIAVQEIQTPATAQEQSPEKNTKSARVIVQSANIRESADKNSAIVAKATLGQQLDLLDEQGEWLKVNVQGVNGFIARHLAKIQTSEYMVSSSIALPRDTQNNAQNLLEYEVTARKVNVRSQPNTESSVIVSVPYGKILKVISIDENWAKVLLSNGSQGFVASAFLRKKE